MIKYYRKKNFYECKISDMDNIFEEREIKEVKWKNQEKRKVYDKANLLRFGLYHKKLCLY